MSVVFAFPSGDDLLKLVNLIPKGNHDLPVGLPLCLECLSLLLKFIIGLCHQVSELLPLLYLGALLLCSCLFHR